MKNVLSLSAACGLVALVVAGCGGGSDNNNGGNTNGQTFTQTDRLARPVVNEVFATFANNRHLVNDTNNPVDDKNELAKDIESFMPFPAGRSQATTNAVKSVLVPDVMIADLSQNSTSAAYLGTETAGATGSKFGGRRLADDTVDISLGVIFGTTVSALGLAPADGKQSPSLTTDNVGAGAKNYLGRFPYLGNPK